MAARTGPENDKKAEEQAEQNPESIQQHLGKYIVRGMLGRGSTGVVYLGYDPELKRKVAIKAMHVARLGASDLPSEFQANNMIKRRFLAEAQSTGMLRHQNIIALYEGNVHGPIPYLVMEYVDGATLDALIKSNKVFTNSELIGLLYQLADAIDYAHSQGVLHRDIKPANIIIDSNNRPYILDFGVAKIHEEILAGDEGIKATSVLGTPAYMSPEQIRNKPLNNQSDLFAFAVVAFQSFCGIRPFEGDTFTAVASSILEKTPKQLSSIRTDLPDAIDLVFAKALAKDRALRFESAKEFVEALGEVINKPQRNATSSIPFDSNQKSPLIVSKDFSVVRELATKAASKSPQENLVKPNAVGSNTTLSSEKTILTYKRSKPTSTLSIFIFFAGLVIGISLIGFYFFWPRRAVIHYPGEILENNPSAVEAPINDVKSAEVAVRAEEAARSAALVQNISEQHGDSKQLNEMLLQLKSRAQMEFDMNVSPLLEHPNFIVKVNALQILISRRQSDSVKEIIPLLDDADPLVRGFAAKAIGVLGNQKDSEKLAKKASVEQVPEVIRALETAIERIGERVESPN